MLNNKQQFILNFGWRCVRKILISTDKTGSIKKKINKSKKTPPVSHRFAMRWGAASSRQLRAVTYSSELLLTTMYYCCYRHYFTGWVNTIPGSNASRVALSSSITALKRYIMRKTAKQTANNTTAAVRNAAKQSPIPMIDNNDQSFGCLLSLVFLLNCCCCYRCV